MAGGICEVDCRLIARLAAADGSRIRVIGLESQPMKGAANQIVDAARARIAVRAAREPRRAGQRLIRRLTRNPPYRARVHARIVRCDAAHP